MSECSLDYNARDTVIHMLSCKFFEILFTLDQADGSKLVSAELLAHHLQTVHECWKHKLFNVSSGSDNGSAIEDDAFLRLGTSESWSNEGVCPALQSWLGDQLAKEALASKERRKAREKQALASKK